MIDGRTDTAMMTHVFWCWVLSAVGVVVPGIAVPTVHPNAVYGVNMTTGVVYAQGLYCSGSRAANFSQQNCTSVDLTLTILRPVVNASTGVPLPAGPLPVLLGIHGGSYTHGDASDE
jgi:acetyl esterase/lipase